MQPQDLQELIANLNLKNMWKPSKFYLFILMLFTAIMGGISLSFIDWDIIEKGKGIDIYNQIDLPVIFFLLSISFMIPYVKKLKEENK